MVQNYLEGKTEKATQMQLDAIELVKALFCEVNPIPVKEAMNMIGFNCGTPRLPLIELSNSGKEQLKKAIENFNK
jgi:4-hydroxy-tetrahydrodipicolinate synthase